MWTVNGGRTGGRMRGGCVDGGRGWMDRPQTCAWVGGGCASPALRDCSSAVQVDATDCGGSARTTALRDRNLPPTLGNPQITAGRPRRAEAVFQGKGRWGSRGPERAAREGRGGAGTVRGGQGQRGGRLRALEHAHRQGQGCHQPGLPVPHRPWGRGQGRSRSQRGVLRPRPGIRHRGRGGLATGTQDPELAAEEQVWGLESGGHARRKWPGSACLLSSSLHLGSPPLPLPTCARQGQETGLPSSSAPSLPSGHQPCKPT